MSSSKRLLLFSCQYLPMIGGMERQIEFIAHAFVAAGWEVDILTPRRVRSSSWREVVNQVHIYRTASLPIPGLQGVSEFLGLWYFLSFQRTKAYDVVHCHGICRTALVLLHYAVRHGWRAVLTVHSHPQIPQPGQRFHRFLGKLLERIDVVAVSAEVSAWFRRAYPECRRISIIDNGVDVRRFAPLPPEARLTARARLKLADSQFVCCYVGRLAQEKGVDVLLKAAEDLLARQGLVLLVGGDGPLRPEVESFAARHPGFRYLGRLDDVTGVYQVSDLYLLASHREGMPVALVEAMSCALPAVVTATGAKSVVDCGETGLVVPVGDAAAFANAVLKLAADPASAAEMGRRGAAKVRREWSGEAEIESLNQLFGGQTNERT